MKILKREQIYNGKVIDLGIETVQIIPDQPAATLEIVRHPGGAVVAAINDKQQVCLLKQYRHAVGQWLWELPAGKIDNKEDPDQTVIRELAEEAGVKAKNWQSLGQIVTSPGVFDEVLYLYLAQNLITTQVNHELDEYIEIHWVAFDEALKMAHNGEIIDAKSIINLIKAADFIQSQ